MRNKGQGAAGTGRRWALTALAPRLALVALCLNLLLAIVPPQARQPADPAEAGNLLADLAAICTAAGFVTPVAADGDAPAASKPYCIFCLPHCASLSGDAIAAGPQLPAAPRRAIAILAPPREDPRVVTAREHTPYRTRAPPIEDAALT